MNDTRKSSEALCKLVGLLILIVSLFVIVIGRIFLDIGAMTISVLLIWVSVIMINFSRKRVAVLAFAITFFAFLMGEVSIDLFSETRLYDSNIESLAHTLLCLYVSLFFFNTGTMIKLNKDFSFKKPKIDSIQEFNIVNLQKACICFFVVTATCNLATAIERLLLVKSMGSYTATFIDYHSSLPSIVTKLSGMTDMVFFLYLATMPNPRKSKFVFLYKLLISAVILLYGTRNNIILTIMMIAIYCIYYEEANNQQYSIIPKRVYLVTILSLPAVFLLFDYIMAVRDSRQYSFDGVFLSLKNIITSMGGSVNVITYGFEQDANLGNKLYSIGNIKDFFTQNIFARTLFGVKQYGGNTVEKALYGNSFSSTITYLVKPDSYLSGYGMGSCYIAEAFHDFGYFGVALISSIYGWILSSFTKLNKERFIYNAIILMATNSILLAPRAYADGFISCFLNFSFILTLASIYIIKNIISMKRR